MKVRWWLGVIKVSKKKITDIFDTHVQKETNCEQNVLSIYFTMFLFFYVYVVVCITYMYENDLTFHELNYFTSIKLSLLVCLCIEFMNDNNLYLMVYKFSWTVNQNILFFSYKIKTLQTWNHCFNVLKMLNTQQHIYSHFVFNRTIYSNVEMYTL